MGEEGEEGGEGGEGEGEEGEEDGEERKKQQYTNIHGHMSFNRCQLLSQISSCMLYSSSSSVVCMCINVYCTVHVDLLMCVLHCTAHVDLLMCVLHCTAHVDLLMCVLHCTAHVDLLMCVLHCTAHVDLLMCVLHCTAHVGMLVCVQYLLRTHHFGTSSHVNFARRTSPDPTLFSAPSQAEQHEEDADPTLNQLYWCACACVCVYVCVCVCVCVCAAGNRALYTHAHCSHLSDNSIAAMTHFILEADPPCCKHIHIH